MTEVSDSTDSYWPWLNYEMPWRTHTQAILLHALLQLNETLGQAPLQM